MKLTEALVAIFSEAGLTSGDRAPTERSLSESLGVSRASIRRALTQLKAEGRLVHLPGCRPEIADLHRPSALLTLVGFQMKLRDDMNSFDLALRRYLRAGGDGRD